VSTIDDWRQKIDEVDKELVRLLNKRATYANEIGKIKEKLGLDAYSPKREEEIVQNVLRWNTGPLTSEALRRLFERIVDESRRLEREAMVQRQSTSSQSEGKN